GGSSVQELNPSLGQPKRPYQTTLLCFVAGVVALFVLHGSLRAAFIDSTITICLALSLVVLTRYLGPGSPALMAFAGLRGFMISHMTIGWGLPTLVALVLGALMAVPLGLLIGLPALRVRGVNLAVVTLAAAFAIDALLFNDTSFGGGLAGRK